MAVVADGAGAMPGVDELVAQLRARGVPGYEIEFLGTTPDADRRLAVAAEIELPLFPGQRLGVPSLFAVAQALVQRRYDALHLCAPTPAGVIALLMATLANVPVCAACDESLLHYAGEATTSAGARARAATLDDEPAVVDLLRAYYGQCQVVLTTGRSADASLARLGIEAGRIVRWQPGVDLERFNPRRYTPHSLAEGDFNVLHVGPLDRSAESELLVEAFLIAHDRAPGLRLMLAGCGPIAPRLRARLGNAVTVLASPDRSSTATGPSAAASPDRTSTATPPPAATDHLARAYATADLLLITGATARDAQSIREAHASGLAVLGVEAGAAAEMVESGRSGCLVPSDPEALGGALRWLARRAALRKRLASGGLVAARTRTWDRSLAALADAWSRSLDGRRNAGEVPRAA